MFWHVSVHPSFCLSTPRGRGVPWPGPARGVPQPGPGGVPKPGPGVPKAGPGGGGTQARSRWGGYPSQVQVGGTPTGGPHLGFPHQTWYPTSGTPPGQTWPGGAPTGGGGVPHQVVLDTPRSVCLLRSCRRTFLFHLDLVRFVFWYVLKGRVANVVVLVITITCMIQYIYIDIEVGNEYQKQELNQLIQKKISSQFSIIVHGKYTRTTFLCKLRRLF